MTPTRTIHNPGPPVDHTMGGDAYNALAGGAQGMREDMFNAGQAVSGAAHNASQNIRDLATSPDARHAMHQRFNQNFGGTPDTSWQGNLRAAGGVLGEAVQGMASDNLMGALHGAASVMPPPGGPPTALAVAGTRGGSIPAPVKNEALDLASFAGSSGRGSKYVPEAPTPSVIKTEPGKVLSGDAVVSNPPGEGNASEGATYTFDIGGKKYVAKTESFQRHGLGATRTAHEHLFNLFDQEAGPAPGGMAGTADQPTVSPQTHLFTLNHEAPAPAGHFNQTPVPAGITHSIQELVPNATEWGQLADAQNKGLVPPGMVTALHPDALRMNYLDLLMGNTDRHPKNFMYQNGTGRLYAIDNGWAGTWPVDRMETKYGGIGNYLKKTGGISSLGDKGAMTDYLQKLKQYATENNKTFTDDKIDSLTDPVRQTMINHPGYNSTPWPTAGQHIVSEMDYTNQLIKQNRDALIPAIDRHLDALQAGMNKGGGTQGIAPSPSLGFVQSPHEELQKINDMRDTVADMFRQQQAHVMKGNLAPHEDPVNFTGELSGQTEQINHAIEQADHFRGEGDIQQADAWRDVARQRQTYVREMKRFRDWWENQPHAAPLSLQEQFNQKMAKVKQNNAQLQAGGIPSLEAAAQRHEQAVADLRAKWANEGP